VDWEKRIRKNIGSSVDLGGVLSGTVVNKDVFDFIVIPVHKYIFVGMTQDYNKESVVCTLHSFQR